jgi:glyoxylase-like metal-dependent hydrolase (beta-lactamase superfamily II)
MREREFVAVAGSERVFRLDDGCAVYLLKDGERGLLIDLGTGNALEALESVGVQGVEAVLFTHAHRDQCSGAARALERGLPLRFPEAARRFVEAGERADLRLVTPLLRSYPGRFLPPRPTPGARFDIRPGTTIAWGPFDIEVVAAPGHLDHQVAFLVDDGPRRFAFCGDAIHSAGKLHEPYHLETDHYTGAGAWVAAGTLRVLQQLRPSVLCPSHGPVTKGEGAGARSIWSVFDATIERVCRLAALKDTICPGRPAVPRLVRPISGALMPLSEHLSVWNNSYFLFSDDGPVLMVDNAGELPASFWTQYDARCSPLSAPRERGNREQRAESGERFPIEVVLVTHIHCDHVEGIEPLRALQPGLQVWAHEAIADAIEAPHTLRRPYLAERGTRVDRRLADGETFTWREYTFRAHYFPGQTDLHAAYETTIDGRSCLFSGDNFYPPQQWGGTGGLCGLNGGHPLRGWRRSIDLVLQLSPEWILASHIQPFPYRRADFLACRAWTEEVAAAMRDLAPDGMLERHHDPNWIALAPYVQAAGDESIVVTATVGNPYARSVESEVRLVVPSGWRAGDAERRLVIEPYGVAAAEWQVEGTPGERNEMVTLEVTFDGEYLGEIAECYLRPR